MLFVGFALSLLVIPLLCVFIDSLARMRAAVTTKDYFPVTRDTQPCKDYTLIVPIYGNVRYLENVEYLRQYGRRVLLTTSKSETTEFYGSLIEIAHANGFRIHVSERLPSPAERAKDHLERRATGGTLRDTIVLDAHKSITSAYVVCIDADTVTEASIDYLVGAFKEAELDIASVPLAPANSDTFLARLQAHEYRMAMRIRRIMPWMISGGCHIAKRDVHRDLMGRHSLFFQGNDVELGLLANLRRYRVGHVPFIVPTRVPSHFRPWFRQRKAWAGGEFRLMIVNFRVSLRHPFLYLYGGLIVILLLPMRWYYLVHPGWAVFAALFLYFLALMVANWRYLDWPLFLYPFYSLFYTMIMVPLGILSYIEMAVKFRNLGMIDAGRGRHQARYGERLVIGELGNLSYLTR